MYALSFQVPAGTPPGDVQLSVQRSLIVTPLQPCRPDNSHTSTFTSTSAPALLSVGPRLGAICDSLLNCSANWIQPGLRREDRARDCPDCAACDSVMGLKFRLDGALPWAHSTLPGNRAAFERKMVRGGPTGTSPVVTINIVPGGGSH